MSKFYITTSIAYVNAAPHIGFALEAVQADVLARWRRQQGEEVFFLTGTDEHGAKIARAAEAAGKTPQELVDENSEKFKALKGALNLSWDNFIRTSDQKNHWPVAQEIWNRLYNGGFLEKGLYSGLYCVGCEQFKPLNKTISDTIKTYGARCSEHDIPLEEVKEENWFFNLEKKIAGKTIIEKVKETLEKEVVIFPETRKNEILSSLNIDLIRRTALAKLEIEEPEFFKKISFSRPSKDISWGIPVPNDSTQTMYVWADALTNYISGYGGIKNWETHPADIHVIGKDILKFHAFYWLAMLLAAELKLPKAIYVHGHILSDGKKMSKSLGNVVDPFELVKKYGADAVRYFLLREIPSSEDGDFSYEKFEQRYNADLANGLGNLVARVAALGEKLGDLQVIDKNLFDFKTQYGSSYETLFESFELDKALISIWDVIHRLDQKINFDKPWADKNPTILKDKIISYSAQILLIADLLASFLPATAEKITESFILEGNILRIKKIENLFPRL